MHSLGPPSLVRDWREIQLRVHMSTSTKLEARAVTFSEFREVVSAERWIIRLTDDQRAKCSMSARVLEKTLCLGPKSAWFVFEHDIREHEQYTGQLDNYIGRTWRKLYGRQLRYEEHDSNRQSCSTLND